MPWCWSRPSAVVLAISLITAPASASVHLRSTALRHSHIVASAASAASTAAEVQDDATTADSVALEPANVKLNFAEAGARVTTALPPVVILHGLFGAGGNFATWAARLNEDCEKAGKPRRIILVDLRNHGDSSHSSSMAFEDMSADVARLLEEQGIERAVLCGHSIGGKVAMVRKRAALRHSELRTHTHKEQTRDIKSTSPIASVQTALTARIMPARCSMQATALLHPERVERLMVLDMAPVAYAPKEPQWEGIIQVVSAMRTVKLDVISSKRDADAMLARTISDPSIRAFVLTNLVRTRTGSFKWRVNLDAIEAWLPRLADWDVEASKGSYGGNTLFVGGGKSRFLRSSHLPAISEQFTRFSLSTIRTADHWVHADEPEALLIIMESFLAAKAAPSS